MGRRERGVLLMEVEPIKELNEYLTDYLEDLFKKMGIKVEKDFNGVVDVLNLYTKEDKTISIVINYTLLDEPHLTEKEYKPFQNLAMLAQH